MPVGHHVGIFAAARVQQGDRLLWLDASDASCVFRDTGGTVPAVVGDTVNHWNDKSGTHNHGANYNGTATLRTDTTSGRTLLRGCFGMSLANPYLLSACSGMTLLVVLRADSGITFDGHSTSINPFCHYTNDWPLVQYDTWLYETLGLSSRMASTHTLGVSRVRAVVQGLRCPPRGTPTPS